MSLERGVGSRGGLPPVSTGLEEVNAPEAVFVLVEAGFEGAFAAGAHGKGKGDPVFVQDAGLGSEGLGLREEGPDPLQGLGTGLEEFLPERPHLVSSRWVQVGCGGLCFALFQGLEESGQGFRRSFLGEDVLGGGPGGQGGLGKRLFL